MWELDYKENWAPKNCCFWTVCWRRLWRVPWTARKSNLSILKEISPECSLGRTTFEAETPVLWSPDAKSWPIWKDPDAGKDWRWEEKGMTEDEIAGWHYRFNGHGFGWTPGVGDGQGGLTCCGSWGRRVGHDWATELNWFISMLKPLTVWITTNCGKFWNKWEYQTAWPASWEICMHVRKQQLELDMER